MAPDEAPLRAPDSVLVAVTAALIAIGLAMVFSASSVTAYMDYHDSTYFLKRQIVWLLIGGLAAFAAFRCDYRRLRSLAPFFLLASIVGCALVFVPHVGIVANGARRWLGGGTLGFQPSEFTKLTLVLYLASALASKGVRIRSLTQGLFPLCFVTGILVLLVILEPDVGTASLLAFTAAAMLFAAGARIVHLIAIGVVMFPPIVWYVCASTYRRNRILAFIDPWKDAQNTGFHIVQSLLALGSGGPLGLGLGFSRQKFAYLPEQYTDFIFAILGEELGLIGTVTVIVLFVLFAYRAVKIALGAPDRFGFFLAIGCMSTIVIQALINVGVVTSSWPVTGVPLPFISFGGSSLVVSLVAVALLVNIGRHPRVVT
jgi:cell division protein FtsW